MKRRFLRAGLPAALFLAGTLFGPVFAQSEETPDQEFKSYDLGEVLVTTKAPKPDLVATTTSISAKEIEAVNAKTVAEALIHVPGIRASTGRKNDPNLSLHGFDQSRILILIDGVPYYETNYGRLDLNQIPTGNIARIDVVKGQASVLYGANAMGGVINIVTKKAGDRPFTGVQIEGGPDSSGYFSISRGEKIGRFSYWANFSHSRTDGYRLSKDYKPVRGSVTGIGKVVIEDGNLRLNSDNKNTDLWLKGGYEADNGDALFANLHFLQREKGLPPATDKVNVFYTPAPFSQLGRVPKYDDWGIDLDGKKKLGSVWTLQGKIFFHDHKDRYDSFSDLAYTHLIASSDYKDSLMGVNILAEAVVNPQLILRLSSHFKRDSHQERDIVSLPFAESISRTSSTGMELQFNPGKNWTIVAGVSRDIFQVTSATQNVVEDSVLIEQIEKDHPRQQASNPMFGVTRAIGGGQLHFGIARKTRFPTLQQLFSSSSGNSALEPERTTNYSLGLTLPVSKDITLDTTLFRHTINDYISRDYVEVYDQYFNTAKIDIRGIEVATDWRVLTGLNFHFDFMFVRPEDRSSNAVTTNVINVPKNQAGVGLTYLVPGWKTRIDLNQQYVGAFYSSLPTPKKPHGSIREVAHHYLTQIKITQPILKGYEFYIGVSNLFDTNYDSESAFPGPGRDWRFGINAKF